MQVAYLDQLFCLVARSVHICWEAYADVHSSALKLQQKYPLKGPMAFLDQQTACSILYG